MNQNGNCTDEVAKKKANNFRRKNLLDLFLRYDDLAFFHIVDARWSGGMVYAVDSKSTEGNFVRVRVSSPAPYLLNRINSDPWLLKSFANVLEW